MRLATNQPSPERSEGEGDLDSFTICTLSQVRDIGDESGLYFGSSTK
jgi:hypothetical protein